MLISKNKLSKGAILLSICLLLILSACGEEQEGSLTNSANGNKDMIYKEDSKGDTKSTESNEEGEASTDEHEGYYVWEFQSLTIAVVENEADEIGTFEVNLLDIADEYEFKLQGGVEVEILEYLPSYFLNDGKVDTYSPNPLNPAFVFSVSGPKSESHIFLGMKGNVKLEQDETDYNMQIVDVTYIKKSVEDQEISPEIEEFIKENNKLVEGF